MSNSSEFDRAQQKVDQEMRAGTKQLTDKKAKVREIELEIPKLNLEIAALNKEISSKKAKISTDERDKPRLQTEIRNLEKDLHSMHEQLERARQESVKRMSQAGMKDLRH